MFISLLLLLGGIICVVFSTYIFANNRSGDEMEYVVGTASIIVGIILFAFAYLSITLSAKSNIAHDSLLILSKTDKMELKVDKFGRNSYIVKDSSFLNLYNYLEANK